MVHQVWLRMLALLALLAIPACASAALPAPTTAPTATVQGAGAGSRTCTLTVQITASGSTVWGTVTAAYDGTARTLSGATQVVSVPCGTSVTLTQKPNSPTTWPFKGWQASGVSVATPTAASIQVTVTGPTTITAEYVAGSGGAPKQGWG